MAVSELSSACELWTTTDKKESKYRPWQRKIKSLQTTVEITIRKNVRFQLAWDTGVWAVSYTHLDVYKRQEWGGA